MRMASARLDGRARLGLFVAQALLVALAATALVTRAPSAREAASVRAPSPTTLITAPTVPPTTTATTTPPPPPPRLHFTSGYTPAPRSVASGGGDERLEAGPVVRNEQISPDGTKIAYSKELPSLPDPEPCGYPDPCTRARSAGIAIANRDGSGEQLLTSGGFDTDPAWLSGDVIVFREHRRDAQRYEFYVLSKVDTLGRDHGTITGADANVGSFAVAPDGKAIAYEQFARGAFDESVLVRDLATGSTRVLTSENFSRLTWSPDGREIAGWRGYLGRQEIITISASGGPVRVVHRITEPSEPPSLVHCSSSSRFVAWLGAPVWSPDSSQLAFTSTGRLTQVPAGMLHDIVVISRDGSHTRVVRAPSLACAADGNNRDNLELYGWR